MMMSRISLIVAGSITFFIACTNDKGPMPVPMPAINLCDTLASNYAASIKAIVDTKCAISGCHVNGFSDGNFSDFTGLKEKAMSGALKNRVIINKDMPPSGSQELTLLEMQKIECWLDNGALNN
jgi:hypothetical protein